MVASEHVFRQRRTPVERVCWLAAGNRTFQIRPAASHGAVHRLQPPLLVLALMWLMGQLGVPVAQLSSRSETGRRRRKWVAAPLTGEWVMSRTTARQRRIAHYLD